MDARGEILLHRPLPLGVFDAYADLEGLQRAQQGSWSRHVGQVGLSAAPSSFVTRLTGLFPSWFNVLGLSTLTSLFLGKVSTPDMSVKLLLVGVAFDAGQRFYRFLVDRFRYHFHTTAVFYAGDPAYDWMLQFLSHRDIWKRMPAFTVTAKSSSQNLGSVDVFRARLHRDDNVDYTPSYEKPHLLRWNGHWFDIQVNGQVTAGGRQKMYDFLPQGNGIGQSITIKMYTRNMEVLSALIADARKNYIDSSRSHVIVHNLTPSWAMKSGGPHGTVKRKRRRPLDSVILPDKILSTLLDEICEFFNDDTQSWYMKAGIPHRFGVLLYGPPGTGKTSTVYALAGELGYEIYTISLSSNVIDDGLLQSIVEGVPKRSILLIEDIDCAFSNRNNEDPDFDNGMLAPGTSKPSIQMGGSTVAGFYSVTLSGLLNVLDGVSSEEGRLFICTTNHIEHLDLALLRPGRIDRKICYSLATKDQARALFLRFFPPSRFPVSKTHPHAQLNGFVDCDSHDFHVSGCDASSIRNPNSTASCIDDSFMTVDALAEMFSTAVPADTFSTAELQGFLLPRKTDPVRAANEVEKWVADELEERESKHRRRELVQLRKQQTSQSQGGSVAQPSTGLGHVDGFAIALNGMLTPESLPMGTPDKTLPMVESMTPVVIDPMTVEFDGMSAHDIIDDMIPLSRHD